MNSCQLSHTRYYMYIIEHLNMDRIILCFNSLIWVDINHFPDCIRRILDLDLDFITNKKILWEFVRRYIVHVMNVIVRYAYTVVIVHD